MRPLVGRLLNSLNWTLQPGRRFFTGDSLTFAALDSVSRARGFVVERPPPPGTTIGVSCPFPMAADSAGLNEKAGPKGLFVAFQISQLTDSTAIAGVYVECGAGVAPISAYQLGLKYRLQRVGHEWVIESELDYWVT